MPRPLTPRKRVDLPLSRWRFRPQVERLEGRLQPGQTFGFAGLGGTLAGTALDLLSLPAGAIPPGQELTRADRPVLTQEAAGGRSPLTPGADPASWGANPAVGDHRGLPALVQPPTLAGDFGTPPGDLPVLPVAIYQPQPAATFGRKALDGGSVEAMAGTGAWHAGIATPLTVPGVAVKGMNASDNLPLVNPLGIRASPLAPDSVAFDPWSGAVLIRSDGAGHTIEEALTSRGFLDVTLDGQPHSSDPAAAAFDPLLAGATAARVTGIQLDGVGQDTLTLGAQQLAGGLTVTAPGATVVTQDISASGSLILQAADITVRGTLQANAVTLTAAGWVNVEDTGRVVAGNSNRGGRLTVVAAKFVNTGQLHADGATGGRIVVEADNILNAGRVTADGSNGAGGTVQVSFTSAYLDTATAVTSADGGNAGPGGQVLISGGTTGHLFSSGRQQATGGVGGAVDLLGREVVLDGGAVDTSGEDGGGSIRMGGDFQGRNPAVVNADIVTVTAATTIRADALTSGDGGRVVLWADTTNAFQGTVSARGGAAGGAGGAIEVSSHGSLSYGGLADAGAPSGRSGALRLDPKNLIISAAPAGVFPQFDLVDPHPAPGGSFGFGVTALGNGNVVVTNPNDDFGAGQAGAVYLFDGLSGAVLGALVGSHLNDAVGRQSITPLANGNYLVPTPTWNDDRGAMTWASATRGISGLVSDVNSLVGSDPGDRVGYDRATPLSNGNYVVDSSCWNSSRGAVTWGNGTTGITGTVSATNSLVGSDPGDQVGGSGVVPLSNGNYVVQTGSWNGNHGAVTWGDGTAGVQGVVSAANSLAGADPLDLALTLVTPLSNGNYVVASPYWNGYRGAVTWNSGTRGVTGMISTANSLIGSNPNDRVGSVTPLPNGNYVVASPYWNGTRGAVTWGDGATGLTGIVSEANSLTGANPGDYVGGGPLSGDVTTLANGNYVVRSPSWDDHRGAVTWGDGASGQTLDGRNIITMQNSLVGRDTNAGFTPIVLDPNRQAFLVSFPMEDGGRVTFGLTDPNQFTYARGQSQTVTLTPDFLTATLDTGTAVVLQASNDITVDDPITVNAHGHGGALTLQAGRSILLNASITTDNGPLALIANDTAADGVIDSQRDTGNATIVMAGGTTLDTGTAPLDIELNGDGSFRVARTFDAGRNPHAVVVGDFNGDGLPDLAVANSGSNDVSILLNDGVWTAAPRGASSPYADHRGRVLPALTGVWPSRSDSPPLPAAPGRNTAVALPPVPALDQHFSETPADRVADFTPRPLPSRIAADALDLRDSDPAGLEWPL